MSFCIFCHVGEDFLLAGYVVVTHQYAAVTDDGVDAGTVSRINPV